MARKKTKADTLRIKRCLTSYIHPDDRIADQYRSIRSNLHYASGEKKLRSLMITSPEEGDGKTTTAVNLAISLTHRGDKVLLIDTNFRNPTLYDVFHIKNIPGLTNVLAGQILLREAVHRTEIGRLDLLTSGPRLHHAEEMLGSQQMIELLESAYKHYDIVIIDVQSVLLSADAKMLAGVIDGSILVVKSGKTKEPAMIEAKQMLDAAKAHIVGAVLNKV